MARRTRSEAGAELAQSLLGNPTIPAGKPYIAPDSDVPFALPPPDGDWPEPREGASIGEDIHTFAERIAPGFLDPSGTRVPAPTDKAPPPLFVTAHKGPGINPDLARIIETTFSVDAFKDYDDLEKNLEVGEERSDYKTLCAHLDKAESRARRAHKLYLGAKLELANWELDSKKVTSVMRGEAASELEAEKAAGERKKAITNDDVESRISEKFPDEWAAQQLTRVKLKGIVDDLEHLTRRWDMKCGDLRTLLECLRK